MGRRPDDSKMSRRGYYALFACIFVASMLMSGYVLVRLAMMATGTGYSAADAAMAVALIAAELFLCMHAVGYFYNMYKAGRRALTVQPIAFARHARASVAVLVTSFNELEAVLEETLASARALDYPINLYLLDDSTNAECQEGARRVAEKYRARLVRRTNRAGYKAGAINDFIPQLTEKYIALLDADQRPRENWLKEMVPYMEDNPDLALVQSPQHYVNDAGLPVCAAAKYQQGVFFEYICEGKAWSNAVFCCGSNCVIRREALLTIETVRNGRVNYWDESSVTEDFATTYQLHLKGWRTDYVNEKYAVGMGPETLAAYFVQQMRWAMGTQGQTKILLRDLFTRPRAMTPSQWWEYWVGSTYYFVGYANFIFMLAPICFMLFDVKPIQSRTDVYLAFFAPYIVFTMNAVMFGMHLRNYSLKGVWLASALSFSTFWIYMRAGMVAVLGLKRAFGVTAKGVGGKIPLRSLAVEFTMFLANCAVVVWGLYKMVAGGGDSVAYGLNTLWAGYHAVLLSTMFFHFNRSVDVTPGRPPLFEPMPATAR